MTQQLVREPTGEAGPGSATTGRRSVAWGLVRTCRPRQWIKNVLVFAAPGAAGVLTQRDALLHTVLAFVVFCFVASGTYVLNDLIDQEADRLHPKKQHRPIAAGTVSSGQAIVACVVLLVGGLGLALAFQEWELALVAAIYVAVTTSYSPWLKHASLIDLVLLAS